MSSKAAEGTAALDKALDVLDAVGCSPAGLSQAELAAQLTLPRTTLYRLLGTLVNRGMLRRDPLRRVYCLGMRCFEYARTAYAMPDLVAAAGAELRGLRDMTGETTYLATLDGREVISLERCDGAHSDRSHAALGQHKPLHCTSQGKAILSALPTDERDAIVKDLHLNALTPHTITDRRRLLAELRLTANRGWSIDDEEIVLGVRCCGAPIVDTSGKVRAAISVAGPAFRLSMARLDLIGPEVAEAARRIGAQLSTTEARPEAGEAEVVPGDWAFSGAFPGWCPSAGALLWADTLAPAIHRADAAGDTALARLEAPVQAALLHANGLAVLIAGRWHLVTAAGSVAPLPALDDLPVQGASAVCVGPGSRLWACVADGDRWRVAELGVRASGSTSSSAFASTSSSAASGSSWRLNEPATALAWDESGQTLHIASATSGALYLAQPGNPSLRRLATVPKGSGQLAGIAIDRRGGVWCALRGGWSVVRFEPDGALDRVIALPVPCPTDLAFGGPNGDALYITTAREAVAREALDAAPLSGRLFVIRGAAEGVAARVMAVR